MKYLIFVHVPTFATKVVLQIRIHFEKSEKINFDNALCQRKKKEISLSSEKLKMFGTSTKSILIEQILCLENQLIFLMVLKN